MAAANDKRTSPPIGRQVNFFAALTAHAEQLFRNGLLKGLWLWGPLTAIRHSLMVESRHRQRTRKI